MKAGFRNSGNHFMAKMQESESVLQYNTSNNIMRLTVPFAWHAFALALGCGPEVTANW
jgi:hypothetical protein